MQIRILLVFFFVSTCFGGCEDGCPTTAPRCCVMIDSTSMCCPFGTDCDGTYGCVLSANDKSSVGGSRTPLHESVTSVYITLLFGAKIVVYAGLCALSIFLVTFLQRTIVIKFQEWRQRQQSEHSTPESSSDEEPDNHEVVPEFDSIFDTIDKGECCKCGSPVNCVLLKCSHAVVCFNCSHSLRSCPKCGKKIHRRQRLFIV